MKKIMFLITFSIFTLTGIPDITAASSSTTYISANNQGNRLKDLTEAFNNKINKGDLILIDESYDNFSSEIKKTERAIGKVSGSANRKSLNDKYVTPAKIARERVIFEVSQIRLIKDIEKLIQYTNYRSAIESSNKLDRLKRRASEIKLAGGYKALPQQINNFLVNKESNIQQVIKNKTFSVIKESVSPRTIRMNEVIEIKFTETLGYVDESMVEITDSNGKKFNPTSTWSRGNSLIISNNTFEFGKLYTLSLSTNLYSNNNKIINAKVTMKFQIVKETVDKTIIYNTILNSLKNSEKSIQFDSNNEELVWNTFKEVLKDHPELLYIESDFIWNNGRIEVNNSYLFTLYDGKQTHELIKKKNEVIKEIIDPNMTDYEKVLAIHDYVVKNTVYDYSNNVHWQSNWAYGALVNQTAVCGGYTNAMYYLLNEVGIENIDVTGSVRGIGHAWNKVKLDGVWYNLDATWDDVSKVPDSSVRYDYFLISDNKLALDHTWDKREYPESYDTRYENLIK